MCVPVDPATAIAIASTVATATGSYVNSRNQNAAISAQNAENQRAVDYARRMKEDERQRQEEYNRRAQGVLDKSFLQNTEQNYSKTAQDAENQMLGQYDAQQQLLDDGTFLPGQRNANVEIKTEIARRTADATAKARANAAALARMTGYGTAGGLLGAASQDINDQLRTLNGIRQGSLMVNQQETSIPAASVRPGDTTLGDVLSVAGQLGSAYAGANPNIGVSRAKPIGLKPAPANLAGLY